MDAGPNTSVLIAFAAGLISFFTPCVLPVVPGYLAAISGVSFNDQAEAGWRQMLVPSLAFVGSFTVIFMLGGMAATAIGQSMTDNAHTLTIISGWIILALGVFLAATIFVPALNFEVHSQRLAQRASVGGPLIAGAAFAIAWSPCLGVTLGAILTAASTQTHLAQGAFLLFFYSAGLAVPFIASALGVGALAGASQWVKRHYPLMMGISSLILIVFGTMILTGEFTHLNNWASQLTGSWDLTI